MAGIPSHSMRVLFTFVEGPHTGEQILVADKAVVRVGRHPDSDLALDPTRDLTVSTHHAELRQEQGGWVLVDLHSQNGTFVGEQRIQRRQLNAGDQVRFGAGGPVVAVGFRRDEATPALPATVGAQHGVQGHEVAAASLSARASAAAPPGAPAVA